jgi:hypothetical protein
MSSLPAHNSDDAIMNSLRDILLTSCKYCMSRMDACASSVRSYTSYDGQHKYGARPAGESLSGVSVAMATGIYDADIIGMSQDEAFAKCENCVKEMWTKYKACEAASAESWYYDWQAASWAAAYARAVWFLWNDLSGTNKRGSAYVVEAEANRILNEYETEYWNALDGDSKGETVAWNAEILQIAQAMMPQHENVHLWRAKEIEMELASLSRPSDLINTTIIEGKAISSWINGYNVPETGNLINHSIIHPDYMQSCIMFLQQAKLVYQYSALSAPTSCNYHCEAQWQVLTSTDWNGGVYEAPGGTIYAADGSYHLYYPEGNNWSDNDIRQDIYLLADVYALKSDWNSNVNASAEDWILSRITQIAAMQARHDDGHMFAAGEFDLFYEREQFTCYLLADAYLAYRGL